MYQLKRYRSINDPFDIVFALSEYNRGWVLDTICRQIARYWPGKVQFWWTRKNSSFTSALPHASAYWFSHYQLLITALGQFPQISKKRLFVWYTHPSKEEIGLETVVAALNQCYAVIFTCTLNRNAMVQQGVKPELCHVILGGVDPEVFVSHKRGSRRVLFSTGYYPRKNPELIHGLVEQMPDVEFTLLAPEREGMATSDRMWQNYPRFGELTSLPNLRYVEASYAAYGQYYFDHDVFVMTSHLEGGPISLLEAMYCNCVPVSSRTGFAPDLIKDRVNGFLFKSEQSVLEVADLVRAALEHRTNVHATVKRYTWKYLSECIQRLALAR